MSECWQPPSARLILFSRLHARCLSNVMKVTAFGPPKSSRSLLRADAAEEISCLPEVPSSVMQCSRLEPLGRLARRAASRQRNNINCASQVQGNWKKRPVWHPPWARSMSTGNAAAQGRDAESGWIRSARVSFLSIYLYVFSPYVLIARSLLL